MVNDKKQTDRRNFLLQAGLAGVASLAPTAHPAASAALGSPAAVGSPAADTYGTAGSRIPARGVQNRSAISRD